MRRLAALALAAALLPGGLVAQEQRPKQNVVQKAAASLDRASRKEARRKELGRYDDIFRKYTKRQFGAGFDWRLFKAQGMAESGLDPTARSWVGARGIMQLMPTTYRAIQSARPEFGSIDDPEWNIAAGIAHDRYLWKRFSKDVPEEERRHFMFGSYNAGEGTIDRARSFALRAQLDGKSWTSIEQVAPKVPRWRYRETVGYVRKIEINLKDLGRP